MAFKPGTNWAKECVRQLLYGNDKELDRISSSLPMPIRYIESGPSKYPNIKLNDQGNLTLKRAVVEKIYELRKFDTVLLVALERVSIIHTTIMIL